VAAAAAADAAGADAANAAAERMADDALAWLLARRRGQRPRDPVRVRALLDALGLPDPPAVVLVAGTNGKGSVATALAAMATAAGHRSGRFTSPHVEHVGERVAIDGTPLDARTVAAFATRARELVAAGAVPDAAFFEWMLALALERFAAAAVTLAVIEAGVGARSDATSVVGNVVASVVTNVTLDHVATLGGSIEAIARDKAAAARPGAPLVTAATGDALEVLRRAARRVGSPLSVLHDGDPRFDLPADLAAWGLSLPATRRENLRLACAIGRLLGFDELALRAACLAPPPPARFERFEVDDRHVVLDGAHDPAAAAALARDVAPGYVLLFGALARKQGAETLAPLQRSASRTVVTSPGPDEPPLPLPADAVVADPLAALDQALDWAGPGGRVVIAGSLYLAGWLRPALRARARPADLPDRDRAAA
jgi:dihydrofolate synthase / folylpolyglutamate synthase